MLPEDATMVVDTFNMKLPEGGKSTRELKLIEGELLLTFIVMPPDPIMTSSVPAGTEALSQLPAVYQLLSPAVPVHVIAADQRDWGSNRENKKRQAYIVD